MAQIISFDSNIALAIRVHAWVEIPVFHNQGTGDEFLAIRVRKFLSIEKTPRQRIGPYHNRVRLLIPKLRRADAEITGTAR